MSCLTLCVLLATLTLQQLTLSISDLDCSAIDSYVEITSSNTTLVSSQALFPPHNYYIPSTPVVTLQNSNIDHICDSSIITDIKDKIVLILSEENDECGNVQKVLVAQEHGAIAVLLSQSSELNLVSNIINDAPQTWDDQLFIPTRGISRTSANQLISSLNNGTEIEIKFGCFGSEYPHVLCAVDYHGDHWWIDGDYQLQADIEFNSHPVWMRSGYTTITVDQYIYLHSANGENDWYWAITQDKNMTNDYYIIAYCGNGSIFEPSECSSWFTTDYFNTETHTFSFNNNFIVSHELCELSDNEICITSSNSSLHGFSGTYVQWNENIAYWFRESTDCDNAPGYLVFYEDSGNYLFILIDALDTWIIAKCIINTDDKIEDVQFNPMKYCEDKWYTLADGLDQTNFKYDNSMRLYEGDCSDSSICPDEEEEAPTSLCLHKNNVMHSFLEGEYVKRYDYGPNNRPEYERSEPLYYNGKLVNIYIWFYGDINDEFKWWVIAQDNYITAKQNGSSVYGYCAADVDNPLNCHSCWNFYWSSDDETYGDWHSDCQFYLTSGEDEECDDDSDDSDDESLDIEWPQYLCINANDSNYEGSLNPDFLRGAYELNETSTSFSGDVPHWTKPENDLSPESEYHIYYDAFYGYWQIGMEMHISTDLICMETSSHALPEECSNWYDITSGGLILLASFRISSLDCSEDDLLRLSINNEPYLSHGAVAFIVMICLFTLCLIIGIFIYCHKQNKRNNDIGYDNPSHQQQVTSGRGRKQKKRKHHNKTGSIELGHDDDDEDEFPLANNTRMGGMDMRPLNDEGDALNHTTNKGGDGDDDSESNSDKQENDIVDDSDELLRKHTNTAGNDHDDSDDYDGEETPQISDDGMDALPEQETNDEAQSFNPFEDKSSPP